MRRCSRKRLRIEVFAFVLMLGLAGSNAPVSADADEGSEAKTIAMIGAGDMGQALGNLWAAAGYHMIFATRNPDELGDVIEAAGHGAEAASVGEAVERADIITLAVPYKAEPSIAEKYGDAMKGKVLVNVDNALEYRDGDIAEKAEAVGEAIYSARLFEGTRFIRAFNLKAACSFPEPDEVESADFEMPWTTNDASVRPIAEELIRATGGTPVYEGGLENAREY
ncbi:NADPH-dependent F420 reductase [Halofilum ochraceum]|uniref:NADPH-dependent F420 reductase n=1 Tax=Halofilum ochraceum TaxID=1611323 RepID=UPI0008D9701C|nr:NAD(P)-binding domain-containing protein [Halofilum ochraceum]